MRSADLYFKNRSVAAMRPGIDLGNPDFEKLRTHTHIERLFFIMLKTTLNS